MFMGPLFVLLGEVSIHVLCPFFNWNISLPGVELNKKKCGTFTQWNTTRQYKEVIFTI